MAIGVRVRQKARAVVVSPSKCNDAGDREGPPKPPALGDTPAKPGRPSVLLGMPGGLEGSPKPPALGDAPAKPGRPSVLLGMPGGLEGSPQPRALGDAHT